MSIENITGVSWLYDTLTRTLDERAEFLKIGIANGVPLEEYRQMVGRYKEVKRVLDDVIPEVFKAYEQSDAEEVEDDGEDDGE